MEEGVEADDLLFDINVMDWVSTPGVNHSQTHVSKPREITCYSRDNNRHVTYGSRDQLCTYTEPKLGSNLGDNYESYVPKTEEDESTTGVQQILTALIKHTYDVQGQADIVTYRNNLNKIGTTPYENRDRWEMDCAQIGNTVFLDIRKTGEDPNPEHQRFMYFGYRFESICTGLSGEPVNANSEFCSISRLRISNHRILLASEIDCASGRVGPGTDVVDSYIELKTMKSQNHSGALSSMYRHRYLKYWLQSYLAGVPTIHLGIRSDGGDLLEVKRMRTQDIPREAREYFDKTRARSRWDRAVCINFLSYMLAMIREACASNPGHTIRVVLNPKSKRVQAHVVAARGEGLSARIIAAMGRQPEDSTTDDGGCARPAEKRRRLDE